MNAPQSTQRNPGAATLDEPKRVECHRVGTQPDSNEQMTSSPLIPSNANHSSTYAALLRTLRPRLIRLLEPIPWIPVDRDDAHGGFSDPRHIWRFLSAATALGLAIDQIEDALHRPQLVQLIRSSLVRWQYSLRGDGVPLDRRHRLDPWHVPACANVLFLLTESSEFQDGSLLSDVARHVCWLARRPYLASWKEATFITAMADAALIMRDSQFSDGARIRLGRFLKLQSSEGWFPENGGPDLGFLSLVVDSFSRLAYVHKWEEVSQPLARATRWLCNFIHDSAIPGGAVCSSGTQFISPYGLETNASHMPMAARALTHLRPRLETGSGPVMRSLSDDMVSLLSVRVALAHDHIRSTPKEPDQPSKPVPEPPIQIETSASGLWSRVTSDYRAIVNLKQGAAFQIIWRAPATELHDAGVAIIFSDSVRVSGRWSRHSKHESTERSVRAAGPFHHPRLLIEPDRYPLTLRLARWFRSLRASNKSLSTGSTKNDANVNSVMEMDGARPSDSSNPNEMPFPANIPPKRLGLRYALGHFIREISFYEDSIEIRDLIETIRPSVAVICQLHFAAEPSPFRISTDDHTHQQPLYFDGGHKVEIRRTYRHAQLIDCTRTLLK